MDGTFLCFFVTDIKTDINGYCIMIEVEYCGRGIIEDYRHCMSYLSREGKKMHDTVIRRVCEMLCWHILYLQ